MEAKKWTEQEIEDLKKLFPISTRQELLQHFKGRTYKAIETKASNLGLHKNEFFYKKLGINIGGDEMGKKKSKLDLNPEEAKELMRVWRKKTLYEAVGNTIKGIQALEPPKVKIEPLKGGKKKSKEELGLLFSDSHIGLIVDQRETGGLGKYNFQIFKKELQREKQSIKRILEIDLQGTEYQVFNIFFLGDIIENRIMRESQIRLTEMPVVEQVFKAVDEIAKFVAELSVYFKRVNAYCITGQHGRITKKKAVLSPQDNFDYLVYHWIKERLRDYKNIKFYIPDSWWMIVERNNTRFYMEHGDQFRSWLSIPFYGLQRGRARLRELLRRYLDSQGIQVDFDYFLVAHFHTHAYFEGILMNGSFPGLTEYSGQHLKLGEPPTQVLFSIHPDYGITKIRPIQLRDKKQLKTKIKIWR